MVDDHQSSEQGAAGLRGANLKPRTIYLLLEHYAFFHSPSQVGDVDQRFMGRDRIIQKLKTLLTNAESSSGAYLVTGYRGMGKSSYVGKVLHDINSYRSSFKRASRYFRILLALVLLAQLDPDAAPLITQWIPLISGLVLVVCLLVASPVRKRIRRQAPVDKTHAARQASRPKTNRHGARAILAELVRIDVPVSAKRPRAYTQDVFLILLLHGLSVGTIRLLEQRYGDLRAGQETTIAILWFLGLYLWNLCARYRGSTDEKGAWKKALAFVTPVFRVIGTRASDWVAHVDQVHIRINLGYDHLSELDVLRLLARNMATAYRAKMRVLSFPQLSWTVVRVVALYFIVGLGYYLAPLHSAHKALERQIRSNVSAAVAGWVAPEASVAISQTARGVDEVVQTTYDKLKHATPLLGDSFNRWAGDKLQEPFGTALKVDGLAEEFRPVPADVDYVFWLYFWLAWIVTGRLAASGAFGVVSHGQILRRLERLNDSIEAHVSRESGAAAAQGSWFSLRLGQSRRDYPRLSEREIEKQLIEILDDVARIPRISLRPEFIVIFDEVDKIEPNDRPTRGVDDEEGRSATGEATDGLRSRQETVLRLLSNLKYLLTTARAKFIFIAGRELFDAALADVSDRNFFMGSIFNDVINVDSFLKDRTHSSGADSLEMSGMTEQFVFSALLPRDTKTASALAYRRWVEQYPECATPEEREIVHEVLDDFVTYLTYRSNGAPKKLSALFERHVVAPSTQELQDHGHIVIGTAAERLYLRFDWKDQYTFSVATYVVKPLFAALDRTVQEFGDKLLVSAAFLIDHLYKFHRSAFSWRNIELTPEILDINRAPHLRQLIGEIVTQLKRGHLKEIDNGLNSLKFRRRISEEISVLSKLNEREAAAFNFTLDESLAIRRHYTRQLRQLQRRYVPHFTTNPTPEWIRSISFLHMIVGDLHFYDEEYDNAIVEYMEAVQLYGDDRLERLPFESFIVFVRNSLKLGFAHEKRRTLDSAFVVYGKLASRIIRFREVTSSDTGGGLKTQDAKALTKWIADEPYSRKRAYVAFREEVAGYLRLLYQPTLAKLHAKEKLLSGGITQRDVNTAEREFGAIVRQPDPLVEADFAARIGNVLFFKNRSWALDEPSHGDIYCYQKDAKCGRNGEVRQIHQLGRDTPCAACRSYNRAIDLVCDSGLLGERPGQSPDERIEMLLRRLSRTADDGSGVKSAIAMKAVAANLASAADVYLSCAGGDVQLEADWVKLLNRLLRVSPGQGRVSNWQHFCQARAGARGADSTLNKLEEVTVHLFLAAGYFRRGSDYRGAGWQYTKLLYVLRDWLRRRLKSRELNAEERDELTTLVAEVARRASQNYDAVSEHAYAARESALTPEVQAARARRPANWDVAEVQILCEELALLGIGRRERPQPSPFEQRVGSLHNRLLELRLQAIGESSAARVETGTDGDAGPHWQRVAEIWREMIQVAGFFGPSYYVNHSLIGTAHFRAAQALGKVKGKDRERDSHRRAAIRHYRMAIDTHAGGDAYGEFIDRMVYLNDDFNDDLYHFCAAQERFWLNRKGNAGPVIYERLDRLRKDLAGSRALVVPDAG